MEACHFFYMSVRQGKGEEQNKHVENTIKKDKTENSAKRILYLCKTAPLSMAFRPAISDKKECFL